MVPQTNVFFAMFKLSFKLKLMTSITKNHMCFSFVRKRFYHNSKRVFFFFFFCAVVFMQGGFVILDIVFGCNDPTHNLSYFQILNLLMQFSDLTTLQSLILGEALKLSSAVRLSVQRW